jgi:DNA polymerase III epsilon subunit family exonuclease
MKEDELILIFFDLETTGLNPDSDEVIEIGAIKVKNWKVIGKFHSFVRPHRNIPSLVTNLTGITFEDVEDAPSAEETRNKFRNFIGQYPLIAHNVSFDRIFLEKFMGECLQNEFFDTLELSRIFFPEFSSHSLQNLVKILSLKKEEAHRAVSDTLMLYSLFQRIVEERKVSSPYLLHRIKEISQPIRHYELIFGDDWEKDETEEKEFKWSLGEERSKEVYKLPFGEVLSATSKISQYLKENSYVQRGIDNNFLQELVQYARNKKVLISVYDNLITEEIINFAKKHDINTYYLGNMNEFVCPKKIDYILSNPDLIPDNLRMSFATLFAYLYKTKDFDLVNAPTHVMKNPLLRLLSFCDSDWGKCEYKDVCPLYNKIKKANKSNLLIVNHSFFFEEKNLNYEFLKRNTIFLNSYRIIKTFYSSKMGLSLSDFVFFATYYGLNKAKIDRIRNIFRILDEKRIGDDATSAALELKSLFDSFNNSLLRAFFGREYFWLERRSDNPVLFTGNIRIKPTFNSILKRLDKAVFVSPALKVDNVENVLKDFTGISGIEIKVEERLKGKFISFVPTFLHSPNREEFIEEFVYLFEKVHGKGSKAVIIFSSNEIMKRVYFLLKRKEQNVKAKGMDLKGERAEIELYLYDTSTYGLNADEIYFVRLPNLSGVNYNRELFNIYSSFILKNIAFEVLRNNTRAVAFYFDGRFKTPSFRAKFEDIFISFPLFVDRTESLLNILSNWRDSNA